MVTARDKAIIENEKREILRNYSHTLPVTKVKEKSSRIVSTYKNHIRSKYEDMVEKSGTISANDLYSSKMLSK